MRLDSEMNFSNAGGFGFSAVRPETLGATEYTLVTVAVDKTGSVIDFSAELNQLKKAVLAACKKSARAEYILLRVVEFNSSITEVHGFKPLTDINESDYIAPTCSGMTALYDTAYASIAATSAFAKTLAAQDYLVNGIVFLLTDGDDTASSLSATDVANAVSESLREEQLESLRTILVGINAKYYEKALTSFTKSARIDQYVDVADATPGSLAKLAAFVSQSISAQSQSLGTGGPSQALTF